MVPGSRKMDGGERMKEKFDKQKARGVCAKYAELKADEIADRGDSCHYKRLMAAMLPAALDRIEELEGQMNTLRQVAFGGPRDYENIVIPELKKRIEELEGRIKKQGKIINDLVKGNCPCRQEKTERIEELEKALIEERARLLEIGKWPQPEGEEARKLAREQLHAEGLL